MELIEQYDVFFERFYNLYAEYSAHTNISAIKEKSDVYQKHFMDSLAALPFVLKQYSNYSRGMQVLDIGSGGGFPAIPLAIVLQEEFPEIHITALDSVAKKTKFIEIVKENLQLKNLEVIRARAEDLCSDPQYKKKYDLVLSRAVAYLPDLLNYSIPLMKTNASFIAYKKRDIDHEIHDAQEILEQNSVTIVQQYIYDDKQLLIMRKAK